MDNKTDTVKDRLYICTSASRRPVIVELDDPCPAMTGDCPGYDDPIYVDPAERPGAGCQKYSLLDGSTLRRAVRIMFKAGLGIRIAIQDDLITRSYRLTAYRPTPTTGHILRHIVNQIEG